MSKKIVFHETQPVITKILNDGHIAYEGSHPDFKELFPFICKSFHINSELPIGRYVLTTVECVFGIEEYESAWAELTIHVTLGSTTLQYPVLITFPTTKHDKKELDELLDKFDGNLDDFYYKNQDLYRSEKLDISQYSFKPYLTGKGRELYSMKEKGIHLTVKDTQDIIRQMKQLNKTQPNLYATRQEIVVFKTDKTVKVIPKQTFIKLTKLASLPHLDVTQEYHTLFNKLQKVKVDMIKDSLLYKSKRN